MRIVVHAGFHKTGTTSLQDFLRANAALIEPHAALYYGKRLGPVLHKGRHYGYAPGPKRIASFRRALSAFLDTVPPRPRIVLTREAFSGAMIGETREDGSRVTGYGDTAAILARALAEGLATRFPAAELVFLYTTRDRDRMIDSAWMHLLRLRRMTEDRETFAASLRGSLDLDAAVARIAAAVAPHRVVARPLEELSAAPEGPAAAVLDLLDLPADLRARLAPARVSRPAQSPALSARLLELNRGVADEAALLAAKRAALAEEGLAID